MTEVSGLGDLVDDGIIKHQPMRKTERVNLGRTLRVLWKICNKKDRFSSKTEPRKEGRCKLRNSIQVQILVGRAGKAIGFCIYKLLNIVIISVLVSTNQCI